MDAKVRFSVSILVLIVVSVVSAYALPSGFARDFTYKQTEGAVDVMKGDQVVARYVYANTAKPYIYPLLSPSGLAVTRNYPMKDVTGEPTDHPHQKSMWVGFGNVNGVDFWTEGDKCGKIVQTKIDFNPISPGSTWSIHTINDWVGPDDKKICSEERKVAFFSCDAGTLIVTTICLRTTVKEVILGDTKEGFFGIRLTPSITMKDGKGHVLNSEGIKDDQAWGKRAKWVDYTGEVNGKPVGVTIFDSHYNPGYPTYWHARDYGLLAANPFGAGDFTGDPKNASPGKIAPGQPLKFTYVTLIHDGQLDAKTLDALCDEVTGKPDKPFTPPAEDKKKDTSDKKNDMPLGPITNQPKK